MQESSKLFHVVPICSPSFGHGKSKTESLLPDRLRSLRSAPLEFRCDGPSSAEFETLMQRSLDSEDFGSFYSGSSVRLSPVTWVHG